MACRLLAPSHYLNQCWFISKWNLRNKLQWNSNKDSNIFIQENAFEFVVWKMAAIFSWPQCVNPIGFSVSAFIILCTCWFLFSHNIYFPTSACLIYRQDNLLTGYCSDLLNFKWNFIEIYSLVYNWQYVRIGSGNGLVPDRQQAFALFWTNVYHNQLIKWRSENNASAFYFLPLKLYTFKYGN